MMEVRDEDISRDNTRLESTNAELRSHLIEATVRGTERLGDRERERLRERERDWETEVQLYSITFTFSVAKYVH